MNITSVEVVYAKIMKIEHSFHQWRLVFLGYPDFYRSRLNLLLHSSLQQLPDKLNQI